jgi:hypothetical protein
MGAADLGPGGNPMQLDTPGWFVCGSCGGEFQDFGYRIEDYFIGIATPCPQCGVDLDWWKTVVATLRAGREEIYPLLALAGARTTGLYVRFAANTPLTIKLEDFGVPSDAEVLYVSYHHRGGGLVPIEIHRPDPQVPRNRMTLHLWPVPLEQVSGTPANEPPDHGVSAIAVTWHLPTPGEEDWRNLVQAFAAFVSGNYTALVIPANVAVESRLGRLLSSTLKLKGIAGDRADDFITNAATYSYQLNVVLPVLLSFVGAPQLAPQIRGSLNRLRSLRNELAHSGQLTKQLSNHEAAELLAGALFGFRYLDVVEAALLVREAGAG